MVTLLTWNLGVPRSRSLDDVRTVHTAHTARSRRRSEDSSSKPAFKKWYEMYMVLIILPPTFPLHGIAFTDSLLSLAHTHPILDILLRHVCLVSASSASSHTNIKSLTAAHALFLYLTISLSLRHSLLCL